MTRSEFSTSLKIGKSLHIYHIIPGYYQHTWAQIPMNSRHPNVRPPASLLKLHKLHWFPQWISSNISFPKRFCPNLERHDLCKNNNNNNKIKQKNTTDWVQIYKFSFCFSWIFLLLFFFFFFQFISYFSKFISEQRHRIREAQFLFRTRKRKNKEKERKSFSLCFSKSKGRIMESQFSF